LSLHIGNCYTGWEVNTKDNSPRVATNHQAGEETGIIHLRP